MADMICRMGSRFVIENPTPELLEYCEQHYVLANPEYAKKVRMGLWLGDTPKEIALFETHGNQLILPYGVMDEMVPFIRGAQMDPQFAPVRRVRYRFNRLKLYDYQQEAVEHMLESRHGILVSPAGSGKTQMGLGIIVRYCRQALWLTHTADLLRQSHARASMLLDGSRMGTITAGRINVGENITFATVQTMSRLNLENFRDMWDVIVVDECHHAATSPTSMTMFGKVLNGLAARHKFGLTATAHRSDGLMPAVYALLGGIQYVVPAEAVSDRILHVGIRPIFTGIERSPECLNPDGTTNYTRLINYLSRQPERNRIIADKIISEKGRSCLILSDRIEHLETLRSMLPPEMREKSAIITGKMTSKAGRDEREKAIKAMRVGKLKYLFASYQLAREGLDIPCLERLFLATPVKDEAVVIQSIGRVARVFEGKAEPAAYDFVDAIRYCESAFKVRKRHYRKIDAYIQDV